MHEGPINIRMSEGSLEVRRRQQSLSRFKSPQSDRLFCLLKAANIRENMFFSDEPGYYKDGEYGIRLESVVQVVRKEFEEDPQQSENL